MKSQPLQSGSPSIHLSQGRAGRWLTAGLGLAAVLAIGLSVYAAVRPANAPPAVLSVPEADRHLDASDRAVGRLGQAVPSANVQAVNAYLAAHGVGVADSQQQAVPSANVQSVSAYLAAHGVGAAQPPAAPNASAQSASAYLVPHGSGQSQDRALVQDKALKFAASFARPAVASPGVADPHQRSLQRWGSYAPLEP